LTSASVECREAEQFWRFEATADAWTGNGSVRLSADGAYIERHTMYSREAAYDGSSDALRLDLGIVADFRDVVLGTTTAFNCHSAGVSGILEILERDGRTTADCRVFGEAPDRWSEWEPDLACPLLE
jgi:hypothetical protein